jgi:hypothetical protein
LRARALRSSDSGGGASARVSAHAETATGLRENNEDAFFCDARFPVYAVSDGMGGHEGGKVASAAAVECVADAARELAGAGSLTNCRALAGSICKCRCGPCRHWRSLAESGEILAEMRAMARPLSEEMAARQRADGRCR